MLIELKARLVGGGVTTHTHTDLTTSTMAHAATVEQSTVAHLAEPRAASKRTIESKD